MFNHSQGNAFGFGFDQNATTGSTSSNFQSELPRANFREEQAPKQEKECYYDILQICKTADAQEIKKAYRKQSLLWHPDKNVQRKEEAEERFKLISEAFQVLSDGN